MHRRLESGVSFTEAALDRWFAAANAIDGWKVQRWHEMIKKDRAAGGVSTGTTT